MEDDDEPGSNGWFTPKLHALFAFPRNIAMFGSGTCFDGEAGEMHHKEFVKKLGFNTNRRVGSFVQQIGKRSAEVDDLRHVHSKIKNMCGKRKMVHQKTLFFKLEFLGKYAMEVGPGSRTVSRRQTRWLWSDRNKRKEKDIFALHPSLRQAIVAQANDDKFYHPFGLIGFTEVRMPFNDGKSNTIFRASPSYRGSSWYDWAIIRFPNSEVTHGPDQKYHCYGKIMGFIKYQTPGYPTFKNTKILHLSREECITQDKVDSDLYVVLECNTKFMNMEDLDGTFFLISS